MIWELPCGRSCLSTVKRPPSDHQADLDQRLNKQAAFDCKIFEENGHVQHLSIRDKEDVKVTADDATMT